MKRRLREISPNPFNRTIFVESLSDESILELAEDIKLRGLLSPVRVTKVGKVLIDGERRVRACLKLRWKEIEVIEEDIGRDDIYVRVIAAAASQRQMSLFEQARLYQSYYQHLKKPRAHKDTPTILEAKKAAIKASRLPYSVTCADQLVHILERGDAELQEKVNAGDISITAAYEKLERREYVRNNPPPPTVSNTFLFPEPTPAQLERQELRERMRDSAREERKGLKEETKQFVIQHQEDLESEEARRQFVELFEPDPPPKPERYGVKPEAEVIKEAFEDLAVQEPPETLIGRLTKLLEDTITSIKSVDEQRARDIVRYVVKPMVLRLSHQFPRQNFGEEDSADVEALADAPGAGAAGVDGV